MKFLLDQNVERRLAAFLRNLGHDVKVVSIDYPAGILDEEVLTHAYKERRILPAYGGRESPSVQLRHPFCLGSVDYVELGGPTSTVGDPPALPDAASAGSLYTSPVGIPLAS